jgi:hypothetical protein
LSHQTTRLTRMPCSCPLFINLGGIQKYPTALEKCNCRFLAACAFWTPSLYSSSVNQVIRNSCTRHVIGGGAASVGVTGGGAASRVHAGRVREARTTRGVWVRTFHLQQRFHNNASRNNLRLRVAALHPVHHTPELDTAAKIHPPVNSPYQRN